MYTIESLGMVHAEQALQFVCQQFVAGSNLHIACAVPYHEYLAYLETPFYAMLEEGVSFFAWDSSSRQIVGCILAGDYAQPSNNDTTVPQSVAPIKALLAELEQAYHAKSSIALGSTLLVDIAVVSPMVRNAGIYTKMRKRVHQCASSKGYQRVVGELSSVATQHLCVQKLQHKLIAEVNYASFNFNGTYPFASITEPSGIQLVEGTLTDPDSKVKNTE